MASDYAIKSASTLGVRMLINRLPDVLVDAVRAMVERLKRIHDDLHRVCRDWLQAACEAVMTEVASGCNEMACKSLPLFVMSNIEDGGAA
ncbi:hypothetical protein [Sterolibacterium denitrificans]|nr:hypothetical protein [Sterolibacterium denitrificans]